MGDVCRGGRHASGAFLKTDPYKIRSNPASLRFFQRRFFGPRLSAELVSPPRESSVSEETINETTLGVVPPAPLGEPFFHKKTWNCYIKNSLTDPPLSSRRNSHSDPIGVSQYPNSQLVACIFGRGGSRFHRPSTSSLDRTAQPLTALARTARRMMIGRRNRAGRSVVKPRLGLTLGEGLEAWR